jgi:protein-disulfide isomerase
VSTGWQARTGWARASLRPNGLATSVVLVCCAVVVTGLVIRRELFQDRAAGAAQAQAPREIRQWKQVAAAGSVIGRPDAPVKIVEFSDFQCPFCARIQTSLDEIRAKYPDQVAIVYRHYPLEAIHPHAFGAALAAACAEEQGRFKPYHDALFQRQDSIGTTGWDRLAEAAGVPDLPAFRECVESKRFKGRVDEDVKVANRIGVQGTPSLIINGTMVYGASSVEDIEVRVRKALAAGV